MRSYSAMLAVLAISMLAYRHLLQPPGQSLPRFDPSSLAPFHAALFNASLERAVPGSVDILTEIYDAYFDEEQLSKITEASPTRAPVLLLQHPIIENWDALRVWNASNKLEYELGMVSVHVPKLTASMAIRMHAKDQPLEEFLPDIQWTQPWREVDVSAEQLMNGSFVGYLMLNCRRITGPLDGDMFAVEGLSLPWRPVMEKNLWMTSHVATPTHFDLVHNFYAQVVGHKRFILFPPSRWSDIKLFPRFHPSARSTQLDLEQLVGLKPIEVLLKPGDVLYIPPFWFHHVVSAGLSVSISTHTMSDEARIRNRAIEISEMLEFGKDFLLEDISCVLLHHVLTVLYSQDGADLIGRLIEGSYSLWSADEPNASGLTAHIQSARRAFNSPLAERVCSRLAQSPQVALSRSLGLQVHAEMLGVADPSVREIMVTNYIQDTCAHYLGPASVDPFLRWIHEVLLKLKKQE